MSEDSQQTPPANDPSRPNEAHRPGSRAQRRRQVRRILLVGGPVVVLLLVGYFYLFGGRYISTENAYVKADKVAISAQVEGPIASVDVNENEHVDKGQVLFRLDKRPFEIALSRAQAALRNARADVTGLKANYAQKQEELSLARQDIDLADHDYKRQLGLARHKVSSQTRLDQAQRALVAAKQHVVAVQQALAKLRAQLGGNPQLPAEQQPRIQQAQAAVDQASLDLEHATVRAPFAGVASNTPEPGQYVKAAQPVMSVVADHHFWIEANYKETDLTYVRPGQAVEIDVDTYPGHTWRGKVASISPATGAEFSVLPAQNTTGNWVKVVQRIPVRISVKDSQKDAPLRAGMSTEVEIDTGYHRLPGFLQGWFGSSSKDRE
ncbi:MAG TPA: HlyD family secretion protein [Gammaproteobacteria bacterium]|nr:HlyD family secretion protein [Gammaproteobacteria bacterium]